MLIILPYSPTPLLHYVLEPNRASRLCRRRRLCGDRCAGRLAQTARHYRLPVPGQRRRHRWRHVSRRYPQRAGVLGRKPRLCADLRGGGGLGLLQRTPCRIPLQIAALARRHRPCRLFGDGRGQGAGDHRLAGGFDRYRHAHRHPWRHPSRSVDRGAFSAVETGDLRYRSTCGRRSLHARRLRRAAAARLGPGRLHGCFLRAWRRAQIRLGLSVLQEQAWSATEDIP